MNTTILLLCTEVCPLYYYVLAYTRDSFPSTYNVVLSLQVKLSVPIYLYVQQTKHTVPVPFHLFITFYTDTASTSYIILYHTWVHDLFFL